MRVDVHTHFLPETYLDALQSLSRSVTVEDRGDHLFITHELDEFPLYDGFIDEDARLDWMDDHGIDTGLLSVSKPDPNEGPFSESESVELARALNDGYAAVRDAHPDRFDGLAVLPFRDPEAAVAEVDRVANDLDLAGVGLHTTVRGRPLSDPAFEPVFDRMDELDVPAFVHPSYNCLSEELGPEEWMLNPMIMFPTETTFQVSRLIFAGFFDDHDFDLVVAHLGGALPYLTGRLKTGQRIGRERFDEDTPVNLPERPVASYLEDLYYDVIAHHPPSIRAAVDTIGGTDHLMFGTDYPFEAEDAAGTIEDLEALGIDDDAVYGGNAARVFDL